VIERVFVGAALFRDGASTFPALAMLFDRAAVRVSLREQGTRARFGGALPLLSLASGLLDRGSLADPPRGPLSESELRLKIGCPLDPLLQPSPLAASRFRQVPFLDPKRQLGALAFARRLFPPARLARKLDGSLIDTLLSHAAQGFERIAPPHLSTLTCPPLAPKLLGRSAKHHGIFSSSAQW
jgi:hypothetical protein